MFQDVFSNDLYESIIIDITLLLITSALVYQARRHSLFVYPAAFVWGVRMRSQPRMDVGELIVLLPLTLGITAFLSTLFYALPMRLPRIHPRIRMIASIVTIGLGSEFGLALSLFAFSTYAQMFLADETPIVHGIVDLHERVPSIPASEFSRATTPLSSPSPSPSSSPPPQRESVAKMDVVGLFSVMVIFHQATFHLQSLCF
jgi:hypothetical protein